MGTPNLLADQVAIVTGAGRGIGRATALALAQAGAAVVVAARSETEVASVNDEIRHAGGRSLAIPCDVSDITQVDYLLVLALRAFNSVDILINNAATVHPLGKVWETSPTAWQKLMAINVLGPYFCARAVLPHMLDRGSGRIINVSSGAAEMSIEGASAYTASKAALERFSDTLASEVAGTGVEVIVFRPGIVDTRMQADMRHTPAHRFPPVARWQEWYDQGQLRPADEPARAVLWLSSQFADTSNGRLFSMNDPSFRNKVLTDLGT